MRQIQQKLGIFFYLLHVEENVETDELAPDMFKLEPVGDSLEVELCRGLGLGGVVEVLQGLVGNGADLRHGNRTHHRGGGLDLQEKNTCCITFGGSP